MIDFSNPVAINDIEDRIKKWILENKSEVTENVRKHIGLDVKELRLVNSVSISDFEVKETTQSSVKCGAVRPIIAFRERVISGPATVTIPIKFSETLQDEFRFSFSEVLKIGQKISTKINFEIVELQHSFSIDVEFGANQEWTKTRSISWEVDQIVEIPPNEDVTVFGFIGQANCEFDFEARCRITEGTASLQLVIAVGGFNFPLDYSIGLAAINLPSELKEPKISGSLSARFGLNAGISVTAN